MNNNYYVYAYIDKDNNNVFYVGMGKGRRAYCTYKSGRNKYFMEYYNNHNCEMFFIKKNLTKEEAEDLETETVMYYHSIGQCYCNSTYNGKRTGVFGERNGNYNNGNSLRKTYALHPELKDKTKHVGTDNGRARKIIAIYNGNKYVFDMVKDAAIWLINSGLSNGTIQNAQSAISQRIRSGKNIVKFILNTLNNNKYADIVPSYSYRIEGVTTKLSLCSKRNNVKFVIS